VEEPAPAIRARGLVRRYGTFTGVNGVDLDVGRGEIFGLLGPNGAGKTSTLRMLCGLLRPTAGSVEVHGIDVWQEPIRAKALIGYLDEEPFVYLGLTGWEFLNLVADLYRVPRGPERYGHAQRLLDFFELNEKRNEVIGSYSHGMRQKIGLASLLIHNARILFLDEPTNGLDPRSARRVKDLLEELAADGVTVVLSTHILEIAQALCHRVAIMSGGRVIAEGTIDELRHRTGADHANLEEIFLDLTGGPEERELLSRTNDPSLDRR
jgi:ABC-2 type transport system ATP-binding protein